MTAQGAYPFDVLPDNPVDALYLDGRKRGFRFPNPTTNDIAARDRDNGDVPAIYRLRLSKADRLAAIYFSPNESRLPAVVFGPFFDGGQMVTPCYWGSHWPLARGNSTGNAIDDRIHFTPCHNSVMSWAGRRPAPLATTELITLDTLGRSRPMTVRRWAWLIGMSDEADARLVDWAKSFATPPSLDVRGARVDAPGYVPERRAIRLNVLARSWEGEPPGEPRRNPARTEPRPPEITQDRLDVSSHDIQITIKPGPVCINPVFELMHAPRGEMHLTLAGRPLDERRYAWDGRTLWLDATIDTPTELRVTFSVPGAGQAP